MYNVLRILVFLDDALTLWFSAGTFSDISETTAHGCFFACLTSYKIVRTFMGRKLPGMKWQGDVA